MASTDFVGFTVQGNNKALPVEIERDCVLVLKQAVLHVGELPRGTRVMLQVESNAVSGCARSPLAAFTVGKSEQIKLDLRLTALDEPLFRAVSDGADASIEILGCIEDVAPGESAGRKRRKLQDDGDDNSSLELPPPPWLSAELVPHDASSLTPEEALELYRRDQILWLRLPKASWGKPFSLASLRSLYSQHPDFLASSWCVENGVDHEEEVLTPNTVLGAEVLPLGAWYVSSILQEDPKAMRRFMGIVPFEAPEALRGVQHDDGVWLFLGSNGFPGGNKKRGNHKAPGPILGRPEHKDDVTHSPSVYPPSTLRLPSLPLLTGDSFRYLAHPTHGLQDMVREACTRQRRMVQRHQDLPPAPEPPRFPRGEA